ncbi:MAG TPA: ferritin-like domain-containing protein [Candidatus Paceibacterota bacterium]|nr:ferritin-like domain-containing protein [Candidatus Paceibacterota bacterium]
MPTKARPRRVIGRKTHTKTLYDLLITKMQVLYDVEQNLVKNLPKVSEAVASSELKAVLEDHFEETINHVNRLEQCFELLDENPKRLEGEAISGLIKDAEWVIKNIEGPEAKDTNLVAALQYIEHYEIAGYGSAIAWARQVGRDEVADILEETLDEEKAADTNLTELATHKINERAIEIEEEE